jgi:hypothetical protein
MVWPKADGRIQRDTRSVDLGQPDRVQLVFGRRV